MKVVFVVSLLKYSVLRSKNKDLKYSVLRSKNKDLKYSVQKENTYKTSVYDFNKSDGNRISE